MKNYYEILEVDKNASNEIIDKAYKTLVKKYHPDLKKPQDKIKAEEKIKEINEAYDVLSDALKKEEYNKQLYKKYVSIDEFNLLLSENIALKKELYNLQNNYRFNDNVSQNSNLKNNTNNYYNFNQNYNNVNYEPENKVLNNIFKNSIFKKKNKKKFILFFTIILVLSIVLLIFGLHLIDNLFLDSAINPIALLIVVIIIIISLK